MKERFCECPLCDRSSENWDAEITLPPVKVRNHYERVIVKRMELHGCYYCERCMAAIEDFIRRMKGKRK